MKARKKKVITGANFIMVKAKDLVLQSTQAAG